MKKIDQNNHHASPKKRLPYKAHILFIFLILQLVFIFMMSSFGSEYSSNQSSSIVRILSQAIPNSKTSDLVFLVRKTAHFLEYAILGMLFYLNLKNLMPIFIKQKPKNPQTQAPQSLQNLQNFQDPQSSQSPQNLQNPQRLKSKLFFLAIFGSFFYACTDEFHQLFVNGRSGQLLDIFIDTLGAIFGVAILILLQKIIKRK